MALNADAKAHHDAVEMAYQRGRADERRAAVAWLRAKVSAYETIASNNPDTPWVQLERAFALASECDAIERGEHVRVDGEES